MPVKFFFYSFCLLMVISCNKGEQEQVSNKPHDKPADQVVADKPVLDVKITGVITNNAPGEKRGQHAINYYVQTKTTLTNYSPMVMPLEIMSCGWETFNFKVQSNVLEIHSLYDCYSNAPLKDSLMPGQKIDFLLTLQSKKNVTDIVGEKFSIGFYSCNQENNIIWSKPLMVNFSDNIYLKY